MFCFKITSSKLLILFVARESLFLVSSDLLALIASSMFMLTYRSLMSNDGNVIAINLEFCWVIGKCSRVSGVVLVLCRWFMSSMFSILGVFRSGCLYF